MIDLQALADEIRPELPSFNDVGLAWDRDIAELESDSVPAVYLYQAKIEAQPTRFDNRVKQNTQQYFATITVCEPSGLKSLHDELRDVLLGRQIHPQSSAGQVNYSEGAITGLSGGLIRWTDIWSFDYRYDES